MTLNVELSCNCGKTKGELQNITPNDCNYIICMCNDCQAFAHFLHKQEAILDENGGTDILQLTPDKIKLTQGLENLKCIKLSPKGLRRWYAGCCNSPIANTISLKVSFVGLFIDFIDFKNSNSLREELIGSNPYRGMGKHGKGTLPENTHQKFPISLMFKILRTIFWGRIFKRYLPNSFFCEKTGKSVVKETVLSKKERDLLRQAVNT